MKKKRVYLIGIGGAGMTALANLLLEKGYLLSGSDKNDFIARKILEKRGAKIYIGHKIDNIKKIDTVVYSSAISDKNIDLKTARKMKIDLYNRFDFLMHVMSEKKILSVAGTHGKSTTTAMLAHILKKANLKPTVYLGAKNKTYPLGSKWEKGKYAVLETDEHDKSFLKTSSFLPIITNVDDDHLDITGPYLGKFSLLKKAFKDFSKKSSSGFIVLNNDDHFLKKLTEQRKNIPNNKVFTFGIDHEADLFVKKICYKGMRTSSELFLNNKFQGKLELSRPGKENIYNALGAIASSKILRIPIKDSLKYLKSFVGVKRRFSILYDKKIAIVDDYAHHPTEISASLKMARTVFPNRRIILILEPHRYSRVSLLYKHYTSAIKNSDILFLLPIDSAGEKPIKGVDSTKIYKEIMRTKTLNKNQLYLIKNERSFLKNLLKFKRNGDVFLFAGPGKIANLPEKFIHSLKKYEKKS
jgi:UDP-N-acetylmuramate--alanine ligase